MAPHDLRRPFKRPAISDQQRRRELALLRQAQQRSDSHNRARQLASSLLSLPAADQPPSSPEPILEDQPIQIEPASPEPPEAAPTRDLNVVQASKLRGLEARRWFARQLMLPEWMIDVPPYLDRDWYVFARPAGMRCFVVSSNGTTVSRLRNGSVLHQFPSLLPSGARRKDLSGPAHSYCILDCIFHEPDQTYYVIDMVCWRGYSLYDCTAEFRFFWLNSKLAETGACGPPAAYHKYRFSVIPIYDCDQMGLQAAYAGVVPYVKDGLLFYNKHAHYQTGNTPLALVWKDEFSSQYFLDTDSTGQVPAQQQVFGLSLDQINESTLSCTCNTYAKQGVLSKEGSVVLELQDDGKLTTSDDPPVVFGCMDGEFLQKSNLRPGNLLRFAIGDESARLHDGRLEILDLQFVAKVNPRSRAFADSYSKVFFQYAARHSPLRIEDLIASIQPNLGDNSKTTDVDMDD